MIWPSDLVFDPTWPRFELVRDIINTNNLTKFEKDRAKNVASIALTVQMLTHDARRTTHDGRRTTDDGRRTMTGHNSSPWASLRWAKNAASNALTRTVYDLTSWPSFWPHMTQIRTRPRYHQYKYSGQVWKRLGQKCGLYCVNGENVDGRKTDDGQWPVIIAHHELRSGELKIHHNNFQKKKTHHLV